jgi:hypothetical protein
MAIKIAENERFRDPVYVLDTDENIHFATVKAQPKAQGRKRIEYFEG